MLGGRTNRAVTAAVRLDFRILGPLEVLQEGRPLAVGRGKQRSLLALLVLHRNEVVPVERLIDELWSGDPPRTAQTALHGYVGRLRRLLGRERLETRGPGYVLHVGEDELDADRFESLLRRGHTAEALALWRGEVLSDLPYEAFAQSEIGRLGELRVLALEQRLEGEIEAGRSRAAATELDVLVGKHPYRERLRFLLMLALYRAGRQAEALNVYQDTRLALVEELGLEPSEQLKELHGQILAHDPGLEGSSPIAALAPRHAERKTATVVCCDLADSSLAQSLDPEAFGPLVERFHEVCSSTLQRHGGTIATSGVGSAMVGVFGIGQTLEDDALRAVRAARELVDRLAPLDLVVRAGVATGEFVTSGSVDRLAGEATSIASQLQSQAEPGGVLLDAPTFGRCRNAILADPIEARLDRVAEAVTAHALRKVIAGEPAVGRRLETPLVGREREIAELRYCFDKAAERGTACMLTVTGPAGVGKTRLARELAASVSGEAERLEGRCLSYGEGITYWPLRGILLNAFGAERTVERIAEALGGGSEAESIAVRLGSAVGLAQGEATRGEIFSAVRRLVETLARHRPLLLVFEDLHWAEATLLDLIEYLAATVRAAPVLLLCLARPEFVERRPGWGGGDPDARSLALEALSDRESSALLGHLAPQLDVDLRARIVSVAEGNPLFVEQMLAHTLEHGGEIDVPPSIQALLSERIDRLGHGERAFVEVASVVGLEFSIEAVVELLGADAQGPLPWTVAALVRRDFIRPYASRPYPEGFRFCHALVREGVYAALPKTVRAELHARFAAWLAASTDGEDEVIGYHLEQAYLYAHELGRVDADARAHADLAADRLGAAARRAFSRGDFVACGRLFARALALAPAGDARRLELLIAYGRALWQLDRFPESRAALEEAIELARRLGDEHAEVRSQLWLARTRWSLEPDADVEGMERAARAAAERFEALSDDPGAYEAWSVIHSAGNHRAQYASSLDALERAIAYGRKANRLEARTIGVTVMVYAYGPQPTSAGAAYATSLLRRGELERADEADVLDYLAPILAMRGEFDSAREFVRQALALWVDAGVLAPGAPWLGEAARVEMLAGNWEEAEHCLRVQCEQSGRPGREPMLATYAALLAHCLVQRDRPAEADEWATRSEAVAPRDHARSQVLWRTARAKLLAQAGSLDDAESLGREAVDLAERTDWLWGIGDAYVDLADVLRLAGRRGEAAAATRNGLHHYEQKEHLVGVERATALLGQDEVAAGS
jgi:DNA-binding SARP family transcriptional activator/tetratricopeptide (TPR) repeat protein